MSSGVVENHGSGGLFIGSRAHYAGCMDIENQSPQSTPDEPIDATGAPDLPPPPGGSSDDKDVDTARRKRSLWLAVVGSVAVVAIPVSIIAVALFGSTGTTTRPVEPLVSEQTATPAPSLSASSVPAVRESAAVSPVGGANSESAQVVASEPVVAYPAPYPSWDSDLDLDDTPDELGRSINEHVADITYARTQYHAALARLEQRGIQGCRNDVLEQVSIDVTLDDLNQARSGFPELSSLEPGYADLVLKEHLLGARADEADHQRVVTCMGGQTVPIEMPDID